MTPSGWYPDAQSDEVVRYWDGAQWTEERAWNGTEWVVRPLGTPVVPVAPPVEPPPPAAATPPDEPSPPPDATTPVADVAPVAATPPDEPPPPPDATTPVADVAPAAATVVGLPLAVSGPDAPVPPPAAPVTVPPRASLPTAAPLTATAASGPSRRRPAALVALAVVVALASGGITYWVRHHDSEVASPIDVRTTRPAPTRPARTTTTSTSTTTSTTIPPAQTPVLGTVARTCGSNGRGDCFVSLRTAPNGASPEVGRLNDGAPIFVVCQVEGEAVTSSVLGRSSTAWSRTPDGKYLSSIYVDAVGFDPLSVQVPCR